MMAGITSRMDTTHETVALSALLQELKHSKDSYYNAEFGGDTQERSKQAVGIPIPAVCLSVCVCVDQKSLL